MTTSADEMISDSLAIVLVDEEAITLSPNEFSLGRRFYNDMLAEMEEGGLLNHTPVVSSGDPITSPAGANAGLKFSLAPRLAPLFGVNYIESAAARSAIASLADNYLAPIVSQLPDTLPVGSGNDAYSAGGRDDALFTSMRVFGGLSRLVQTTTISTIDTPVLIGSTWNLELLSNIQGDGAGKLTFQGGRYLSRITVNLTIQAASGDTLTFYIYKNGAQMMPGVPVVADQVRNVFIQEVDESITNDFYEIFVENNSDTTNVVIDQGTFRIT